jgi:hypothetical protein
MADQPSQSSAPAFSFVAVTPSDTVGFGFSARGLYVGVGGTVAVVGLQGGSAVNFVGVPTGAVLDVQCIRVNATGTTATNIVALA